MSAYTVHSWNDLLGHAYRLRLAAGKARVERALYGRGPWRRMPYPQHLADQLAEIACGREWRKAAQ